MTESKQPPSFGMYLYGWYDKEKWRAHKTRHTPQPGYYCSREVALAEWQVEQIARTGVDYVVFEMVPVEDHSFHNIVTHVKNTIPSLKEQEIGYSFFIDFWVFKDEDNQIAIYKKILEYLECMGWLSGIYDNHKTGKSLFLFCPYPDNIRQINEATPSHLTVRSVLWSPTWGTIRPVDFEEKISATFSRHWQLCTNKETSLVEALEPLGYLPFWQETEDIIRMNEFTSVIPGYDDLLLDRDPQLAPVVPRNNGKTLVEQFQAATDTGASSILIYGWNEYFESTTIEPTIEYGDFYVELLQRLISQVRQGKTVHFPNDLVEPQSTQPVYLTPDLMHAAQRHEDKVPRWDQDDYVAKIHLPHTEVERDTQLLFLQVAINNAGLKTWAVRSHNDPIRLGIRLRNNHGEVVREGRADLGQEDIHPGMAVTADLGVEITSLSPGSYLAEVDVVWEGKFWFESAIERPVAIGASQG